MFSSKLTLVDDCVHQTMDWYRPLKVV